MYDANHRGSALRDTGTRALGLAVAAAVLCGAAAAQVFEIQELTGSDTGGGDEFGSAAAMDGDTMILGAPRNDGDRGAVYVYVSSGGVWSQQARLTASDAQAGDQFGVSVAIDGDTVIVGATFEDGASFFSSGAAYVFTRTGTTWSEQAKLTASDASDFSWLGDAVDVDGDRAIVGAPFRQNGGLFGAGAAYVYVRSGTTWSEEQILTPSDPAQDDLFGREVAIDGVLAAVSSMFDDDSGGESGSVYSFFRTGTTWAENQKLIGSGPDDLFGTAVALDFDTLAIGAIESPFMAPCCTGTVHVYRWNGSNWVLEQSFSSSDGAAGDNFGIAVSVEGDTLVASALHSNQGGTDRGSAYLFQRSGSSWSEITELLPSDPADGDAYGDSVAVSGDTAVVGASRHDGLGADAGAGYVYGPSVAPGSALCFGDGSGNPCPCSNESPSAGAGCVHSGGLGMRISGSGTTSIAADDLTMTADDCPLGNSGIFYSGKTPIAGGSVLYDGLQCAGGDVRRYQGRFQATGTVSDTGFVAQDPSGIYFNPGDTIHFQYWSRDVAGGPSPCGTAANFSPAYVVTMTP